ncbi:DNA polymerase III subunit psi [Candidatus Photodesmus katoptron]|uniref:DNA polymerase III subunit psi n=1 Tax=Candidatus Photodesmus katoptron Akat1 TaxID=1236703 RepID=S3DZG4_9GAMM|nr:DNA polymerase III subunit psi [Candidatus Photodesmus katoptron]EPE37296.1 DNA polymerase III psi subunit [Candidatus Photodesmus katoptron Akat1]KEY90033.1 DNA polymerase III subunit psi [Candidatus Photodesmus katoptron]
MKKNTSSSNYFNYLKEMGITQWILAHPEKLSGYQLNQITLPSYFNFLLVSPVYPENETAKLFENVLKSMQLNPSEACHVLPEYFNYIEANQLKWIWFAGHPPIRNTIKKSLVSPLLEKIIGNKKERYLLWQQICSLK